MNEVKKHFILQGEEYSIKNIVKMRSRRGTTFNRNVSVVYLTDVFICEKEVYVNVILENSDTEEIKRYINQELYLDNFIRLGLLNCEMAIKKFNEIKNKIYKKIA